MASRILSSDFIGGKMTVHPDNRLLAQSDVYVVVQFYPWFIVMYDNEFEKKKENDLNQG